MIDIGGIGLYSYNLVLKEGDYLVRFKMFYSLAGSVYVENSDYLDFSVSEGSGDGGVFPDESNDFQYGIDSWVDPSQSESGEGAFDSSMVESKAVSMGIPDALPDSVQDVAVEHIPKFASDATFERMTPPASEFSFWTTIRGWFDSIMSPLSWSWSGSLDKSYILNFGVFEAGVFEVPIVFDFTNITAGLSALRALLLAVFALCHIFAVYKLFIGLGSSEGV
jgi:hypothetical protein